MTESVWLVLAGGIVGVAGSLVPIVLQRRWQVRDRRRAMDRKALEAAVDKLMAWHAYAVKSVGGMETRAAHERLAELDTSWQADFTIIPDRDATQELVDLCRDIYNFPSRPRDPSESLELLARLTRLQDRVTASAQRKRRDLPNR